MLATLAPAAGTAVAAPTGGASPSDPALQPPKKAVLRDGEAIAPAGAPLAVRRAIRAANEIRTKPYRYGGGHASFVDTGYDCSGAVSYVLRGARLLRSPLSSGPFMTWGQAGPGRWITVYAHRGHAFIVIAGLRFDTGYRSREAAARNAAPGRGPRWGYARPTDGYTARHPARL